MHSHQFSTSDYDEYDQSFGNKKLNKVISENSPFKDYTNPSVQTTHKKTTKETEKTNASKDSINPKSFEEKENVSIPSFFKSDHNSFGHNYSKNSDVRDLMTELETIKYKYSIIEQQASLQQERIQTLEQENETVTRKYEKLKSDYFVIKNQFSICKREIEKSFELIEAAKASKQEEIEQIQDKLAEINEVNQLLEQENENYRAKISELTEDNAQLTFDFKELQEKYSREVTIFEVEKNNFLTKFKETQDKYYQDVEKLGDEKNLLQKQRTEYLQSLSEIEKKHQEYIELDQKMKEEIAFGQAENEKLNRQIEILNQKIKDEKDKCEIFIRHDEELKTQMQGVLIELSNSNHKNLVLDRENQKLRQDFLDKAAIASKDLEMALYEQNTKNQKELDSKKIELEEHRNKILTLREEKENIQNQYENLKKEHSDLKKTSENEKERYANKVSSLKKALKDAEKEHKSETDTLLKKINEISEENKALIDTIKKSDEEYNRLQEEIYDYEAQMQDQSDLIVELKEQINLSGKEKENLLENIKNLNTQITTLVQRDDERIKLQIKEQEHLAKIKSLEMTNSDLKFQNEELEKKTKNMLAASASKARRNPESEIYNMGYQNPKKGPFNQYNEQYHDTSNSTFRYESVPVDPSTDEMRSINDNFAGTGNLSKKSTSRNPDPPEFMKYEESTTRKTFNDAAYDIKKLTQRYNEIKNKFNYDL